MGSLVGHKMDHNIDLNYMYKDVAVARPDDSPAAAVRQWNNN